MNSTERDETIESLVDRLVEDRGATRPAGAAATDWEEALGLVPVAAALRALAEVPPPLEQDRVAAMLGLVPDEATQLDAVSLARIRKTARLSVSELAQRLTMRGWNVKPADVFKWEAQSSRDVPPAMIASIATVLGVPQERLTLQAGATSLPAGLKQLSQGPEFRRLAERLAAIRQVTTDMAASMLQSSALATVKRGDEPDGDQWLTVLTEYVNAMERRDET